jgi:parallel beta-helix repeat protein
LTIEANTIYGDETESDSGIKFGSMSSGEYPAISGNEIAGLSSGYGIYARNAAPTITENEITLCGYGIHTTGGTSVIGLQNDSSSDNNIHTNWMGIRVQGGTPVIRNNQINGNTGYGVYVYSTGNPDLGTTGGQGLYPGKNTFTSYTPPYSRCITNNNTSVTVSAQGNYFGGSAPTCTSGNVDTANWLSVAPAGMRVEIGKAPGSGIQPVLHGVYPNPFPGSAGVRFGLPDGTHRVQLRVYDLSGRKIRDFGDAFLPSGQQEITWDGNDDQGSPVVNGIYFVRLVVNGKPAGAVKALVTR